MAEGGGILRLPNRGRMEKVAVEQANQPEALERIARDIQAIREEYVQPKLLKPTQMAFTATGDQLTIDSQNLSVGWLIVDVFTGAIDVYFGDGASNTSVPHMRFGVTPFPVIVPVAVKPYVLTVFCSTGPATATLIMVS